MLCESCVFDFYFFLEKGPDTKLNEFSGKIQTAFDPLPAFSENDFAISYNGYGRINARRYEGKIVWNACTWFPEIGTILWGGGVRVNGHLEPFRKFTSFGTLTRPIDWPPPPPFGTFPKNHPIWYCNLSLTFCNIHLDPEPYLPAPLPLLSHLLSMCLQS